MEWSTVHDNLYGISNHAWNLVQLTKTIPILEIDVQGARHIKSIEKQLGLSPTYVFIAPPSIDMLKERLLLR
jgi:guanylate kinase